MVPSVGDDVDQPEIPYTSHWNVKFKENKNIFFGNSWAMLNLHKPHKLAIPSLSEKNKSILSIKSYT